MNLIRHLAVVSACVLLLEACGGGGGGGGGGGDTSPSQPGGFTLSATSAEFSAVSQNYATDSKQFALTITGTKVAAVGAAYAAGQRPADWLDIDITGAGTAYVLHVRMQPVGLAPGDYSAAFTVGTADANGGVLETKVFTVTARVAAALSVDQISIRRDYQFGDVNRTEVIPLQVTAAARTWTMSSSVPWLKVPTTAQSGSGSANVTLDITGLAPGSYSGSVRVGSNLASYDYRTVSVTMTIAPAAFSVSEESVVFGGEDGTEAISPVPLQLTLAAGEGVHPFTAALSIDSGGEWITLDQAAGMLGPTGATVTLNASREGLTGGTYTGELTLSTDVYGTVLSETLPITFNVEAKRLIVGAAGVGLSSAGGREVLTRAVKVFSSVGSTTTPWTAVSDSPWLAVTPSGSTGSDVVLTATPGALAMETTHFANVTVSSSDPTNENTEVIRVGLHLTASTPAAGNVAGTATHLATSPVEPLVAVSAGTVKIYDLYNRTLVRELANAAAVPAALTWSPDGRELYVFDSTNRVVNAMNPQTGALLRSYDSQPVSGSMGSAIAVMRPNGYPILITPSARTYDLGTHTQYSLVPSATNTPMVAKNAYSLMSSTDQSLLVPHFGSATRVIRTALNGGGLLVKSSAVSVGTAQGREGEACISAAGDRIYTASGAPYNFPATSTTAGAGVIQVLPGTAYPNAVRCVWNGLVIGGADAYYEDQDIFIYNGATGLAIATRSSNGDDVGGYRSLNIRGMAVSADGTRLISLWRGPSYGSTAGTYFHDLPAP